MLVESHISKTLSKIWKQIVWGKNKPLNTVSFHVHIYIHCILFPSDPDPPLVQELNLSMYVLTQNN